MIKITLVRNARKANKLEIISMESVKRLDSKTGFFIIFNTSKS